jgi:hypothetical protein
MNKNFEIQIPANENWRNCFSSDWSLFLNKRSAIMPSMADLVTEEEGFHTKREDSNVYS